MMRMKLPAWPGLSRTTKLPPAGQRMSLRPRRVAPPQHSGRFVIAVGLFFGVYALIGGRLLMWGALPEAGASDAGLGHVAAARPDLVDRNGEVLATDIKTASLFAEPRRIVDADEATQALLKVLPDLDAQSLHARLSGGAGFVWLKRQLTPRQQSEVFALGLPGIGFRTEKRRFYPGGAAAAHVVGLVDADNQGVSGMEKYIDDQGFGDVRAATPAAGETLQPIKLSIDLRVQHIVRDEICAAMRRYDAIAAGGVVLDVDTGEVLAMASMPDYDPNQANEPKDALKAETLNRMSAGTFEMGSTFKTFTTAMALDSGLVKITDSFDASRPIRIGGFTISDFHGKNRVLTVPEIFEYSSNIGTAKEADLVGIDEHKAFLTKLGLLTRLKTELPETAMPAQPKVWKKLNSITISFGHGVSTTPLQTAVAAAALVNGGRLIPPTFLPRTKAEADALAEVVVKKQTSDEIRYLFDLNARSGSGRGAEVPGYHVGGKTGTAEKVVNGRYAANKRFNAYLAAFPIDKPRYVVLVVLDEPKAEAGKVGATASMNAAPTVGAIIRRSAALLKVKPDFGDTRRPLLVSN